MAMRLGCRRTIDVEGPAAGLGSIQEGGAASAGATRSSRNGRGPRSCREGSPRALLPLCDVVVARPAGTTVVSREERKAILRDMLKITETYDDGSTPASWLPAWATRSAILQVIDLD